jgi:(p)ppGpp synthase/HD superfamily hydrolase
MWESVKYISIIKETSKAILLEINENEAYWFPKHNRVTSLCKNTNVIQISYWLFTRMGASYVGEIVNGRTVNKRWKFANPVKIVNGWYRSAM